MTVDQNHPEVDFKSLSHRTLLFIGGNPNQWDHISQRLTAETGIRNADTIFLKQEPSVEDLRQILQNCHYKPRESQFSIVCIYNIGSWKSYNANSILKTIEEPPAHLYVAMFNLDESSVLDTIVSRSHKIIVKNDGANLSKARYPWSEVKLLSLNEKFALVPEIIENSNIHDTIKHWIGDLSPRVQGDIMNYLVHTEGIPISQKILLEVILIKNHYLSA